MLLGIISNVVSSGTLIQSTMTMITTTGIPTYSSLAVIALIALLCLKEVLSTSKKWNKYLSDSFNMATVPLLFSLTVLVFFKAKQVI